MFVPWHWELHDGHYNESHHASDQFQQTRCLTCLVLPGTDLSVHLSASHLLQTQYSDVTCPASASSS